MLNYQTPKVEVLRLELDRDIITSSTFSMTHTDLNWGAKIWNSETGEWEDAK